MAKAKLGFSKGAGGTAVPVPTTGNKASLSGLTAVSGGILLIQSTELLCNDCS